MGQAQPIFRGRCHNVARGDLLPEGALHVVLPIKVPQRGAGHHVGNSTQLFSSLSDYSPPRPELPEGIRAGRAWGSHSPVFPWRVVLFPGALLAKYYKLGAEHKGDVLSRSSGDQKPEGKVSAGLGFLWGL